MSRARKEAVDKLSHLNTAGKEGCEEPDCEVARTAYYKRMDISTDTVTDELRLRER